MRPSPFTSRSAGVLFWGAGYLIAAIAWGIVLAALWPQGQACTTTCAARIEDGAIAIGLLALGGFAGSRSRSGSARPGGRARPGCSSRSSSRSSSRRSRRASRSCCSAPANGDSAGLQTVRSAWSWAFAVPASGLLATAAAARLRLRLKARSARPAVSARARRA